MTSRATNVADYLAELPEDRRQAIEAVRQTILANMPEGIEEGMQYGMLGYYVPHALYPHGYHCDPKQPLPFASLASQKHHMAVYLFCVYADEGARARFVEAYQATGKKLDMGAGCVRFKKLDDLPLDVLADALRAIPLDKFIADYETVIPEKVMAKRKLSQKL